MPTHDLALEVKRITRLDGKGATRAFCDVAINGAFLVRSVKVIDGKKGLFVSMPSEQGKNGKWYETVSPLHDGAKAALAEIVLAAYHDDVKNGDA